MCREGENPAGRVYKAVDLKLVGVYPFSTTKRRRMRDA